jgi:lantibiotic modifying enzyme
MAEPGHSLSSTTPQPRAPASPSPDRYLNAALAIAEQLARDAVPSAPGVSWEGDTLLGDTAETARMVRGCVGTDLYAGTAGIGWFLGHTAAYTGDPGLATVAVAALQHALAGGHAQLQQQLSLHAGAVGVALSAVEVAERLDHAELRSQGLTLARCIASQVLHDPPQLGLDLIGGAAGVVVGLLALARRSADSALLDATRGLCRRLALEARREWWGTSWHEPAAPPDEPALCGLGHGMSGIGWALAEAAWAGGAPELLALAQEAFRYEHGWFSAERCAWPDLRQPSELAQQEGAWPGWTVAWCHGALGIGATRLRLYEATGDTAALADASAALQAARVRAMQAGKALSLGHVEDVTLCHGLGGAVELSLLAHEVLGQPEHLRAARRMGDLCLDARSVNQGQWPSGVRGAQHVPGLFLGLAGVGVTLLRLHDASIIGCPLLAGRDAPQLRRHLPGV